MAVKGNQVGVLNDPVTVSREDTAGTIENRPGSRWMSGRDNFLRRCGYLLICEPGNLL